MSYKQDEISVENGQPIELYLFTYDGETYNYTSSYYNQNKVINGISYAFNADYIKRSDSLKSETSNGAQETCSITVARTNSVALLYQGAPPEQGSVRTQVFRVHGEESADIVQILDGIVSQVKFSGSEAELTITIESALNRLIPNGRLSYTCQNCIYDSKCSLDASKFVLKCYIDEGWEGLYIYSANLREKPSGYFTDGYIKMGRCFRQIKLHEDNRILLKYPINDNDKQGSFFAYPGCSNVFKVCAERFNNTDNFSGIPYLQPYDVREHPVTNNQAYWQDGNIVIRDSHGKIYNANI